MVSARRPDPITRREFPLQNAGGKYIGRLLRDRPSIAHQLFIDRDEIPTGIARAANDREDTLYDLSFAPLPPESNPETSTLLAIPAGEESSEEEDPPSTDEDSDHLSDCPTVVYDLDNPTIRIPPGLLRAFERNGEIGRTRDQRDQTVPSPSPPRTSDTYYSTPNYSPVDLRDIDPEPIDISSYEENLADFEVNQILDYLNSEEFLESVDVYHP